MTYDWAQSHEEVLIELVVPATATAQEINVKFGTSSLLVAVGPQHVIDGLLFGQIDTDNSSWRLGEPLKTCIDLVFDSAYSSCAVPCCRSLGILEVHRGVTNLGAKGCC